MVRSPSVASSRVVPSTRRLRRTKIARESSSHHTRCRGTQLRAIMEPIEIDIGELSRSQFYSRELSFQVPRTTIRHRSTRSRKQDLMSAVPIVSSSETAAVPLNSPVRWTHRGQIMNVSWSTDMTRRFVSYLNTGPGCERFDCTRFARLLVDGQREETSADSWSISKRVGPSSARSLSGGTIVVLMSKYWIYHWMIHLADGWFLSKYGSYGPLIVTTLAMARQLFPRATAAHTSRLSLPLPDSPVV
jgi:hypothetical protein